MKHKEIIFLIYEKIIFRKGFRNSQIFNPKKLHGPINLVILFLNLRKLFNVYSALSFEDRKSGVARLFIFGSVSEVLPLLLESCVSS
jgi:hypothetical protein